jgi:hypothetical protein
MDILEITRRQGVIPDLYGKAPDPWIKGRTLRHSPGAQDLADLEPQVEMQRRRVMKLHDEARHRHDATAQPAGPIPAA